jgi:hypothetical protein
MYRREPMNKICCQELCSVPCKSVTSEGAWQKGECKMIHLGKNSSTSDEFLSFLLWGTYYNVHICVVVHTHIFLQFKSKFIFMGWEYMPFTLP